MSTIAVIGHTGFVGASIVDALQARGDTPTTIDLPRVHGPIGDVHDEADRWIERHRAEIRRVTDALSSVDAVINAAGAAEPDSSDATLLWSANTLLPAIVARLAVEAGIDRLVHVSSAAVQGSRAALDETDDLAPESPYARSKAGGESALAGGRAIAPKETVIYRPTSVMGVGRPTTQRVVAVFRRLVPAQSDTPLPLTLVENVGDAAAFLATTTAPPSIVTHPSEGITAGRLAELAGGRVVPTPEFLSRALTSALRRLEHRRPGAAGVRRRVELLTRGQHVNATALNDLGWTPPFGFEGYVALVGQDPTRPIRIAYLITRSDTIAGAQVHVRDLSEAMTQAGHTVRVFVGGDGPLVNQLQDRGVDVVSISSLTRELGPRDGRALIDIRRALKVFDPDLLSCHSSKSGILGRLAGRSLGIPTIFTAHGWSFADGIPDGRRRLFTLLERAMAPLGPKLITVAHKDRELAEQSGVGRAKQHLTIHNAVHDVDPRLVADPSIDPPTIISIARLDEQKDHPLLFEALSRLPACPRVLLVGDGPAEDNLRSAVERLGLSAKVDFLGLRHDVPDLLAQAQIYVLASNWEGLPRSIIEALRAGLPVIATDVGGVSELVDRSNGRLLPHGDLDALEDALRELLEDRELRASMGTASRERYEDHFTFDRVLAETRAVYTDVIGRPT